MYTPPTETFLMLNMFELDKIATAYYGRKYVGQQTGDMISNDSYVVFYMEEDDWEYEEAMGDGTEEWCAASQISKWLDIDESQYTYYYEVYRQAPTPEIVLAHLISQGQLPHGRYLLQVSW